MCKFFLLIALFLCCSTTLSAQQQMGPYMAYGPEAKYFSNINFTVYQSKEGFLWIGTQNGLVRFDGRRYKNYYSDYKNPNSPSDNNIPEIVEDKNGDLWFCGFFHGLTKYNESTGIFKKYTKPTADNFSYYGIYSGLKDKEGNLWFATAGRGLAKYIYEKDSFTLFFPEPDKCKDGSIRGENYVTGLCEDKFDKNILWISSFKGLHSFNKISNQFIYYPSGVLYPPSMDEVQTLNCEPDNTGNIWLPSWGGGILCFNSITKKYDPQKRKPFPKIVNHLKIISDSILLAACFDDGLYQLNVRSGAFTNITPPRNLADLTVKNTNIQKISLSKDAGIFIGGNYYVYQLHPSFSRLKKNIFYEEKLTEVEMRLENVFWDESSLQYWITAGNGIYTLKSNEAIAKKGMVTAAPEPDYRKLNSIIKDSRKRIWISNEYNGVYLWNETKNSFVKPTPGAAPLPDSLLNSIFRLQTDSSGNIWMLSWDHLIYYDVYNNKYESYPINRISNYKGSKSLLPAEIRLDSDENPWVITLNGLFVCNRKEKKIRHIYDTTFGGIKYSYNSFWGGAFDKQDNLWLTSPNGIHVYSTRKNDMVNSFTIADGLPSLVTTSITVDKENRIWVNTAAGLAMYNQDEKIWRTFNRFDGMDRDYLDGTIAITSNNKIAIDQGNGFLMKDVSEIVSSDHIPVLQITSLTLNDKEVISSPQSLRENKIKVPFNQNNISIEFAAMDWLYPFKTNYLVKIDGLQSANTWTANPDARINLTGLAPGNYVAHIKAINSSGVWSNEINLSIIVTPPFWQTPWFIVLTLLAIATLLYLLYRFRIQQLLKMQNLRNDISRDLHDEIGSSVSSVNMLALVAKKKLGEQHPVTPLLSQIGESAQNAGDSIDEIIWSVNPHNDSAQETINRIRKYMLDVFEIHGIDHSIRLPEFAEDKKLSMQVRRDLWLICKEAINNLVKYAHCSQAVVEMAITNGLLRVKIEDNGTGFDIKEASTKKRNGLRNMSERVQKYKTGTFSIDSAKDKGTTVLFQIPIAE